MSCFSLTVLLSLFARLGIIITAGLDAKQDMASVTDNNSLVQCCSNFFWQASLQELRKFTPAKPRFLTVIYNNNKGSKVHSFEITENIKASTLFSPYFSTNPSH